LEVIKMKRFSAAILLVVGVATIMSIGTARTGSSAPAYQRDSQPQFFDFTSEFEFVPSANTSLVFQNPVRIRNINYPWVLVEPLPAPTPTRQATTEIWVNMDFIAVVKKRR
jgi:hypothetical protein